ncbi:uncharacterized protein LOC125754791 isoform X28 [Canis lupus dingo]|uniref:uncharacterized protein LOC125754791 isoform X28 n=1 Tax=Canis lupus dingo TaxID=286419 RepID=UPI0020C1F65C|nr:uncharacterized protein LOC125754791 isoform X28 [Canis lupus dingo]
MCRVRAQEPGRAGTVCPRVQGQGAGTSPGGTGVSPCAGSGHRNQAGLAQCVPVCRVRAREPVLEAQCVPVCRVRAREPVLEAQCVPVCRIRAREPVLEAQVCPRVQGQGAGTSPGGTGVSPCAGSGRRNQSWRHRCVPVCRVRAQEPGRAGTVCPHVQGQGAGTRPCWHSVSPCAGSGRRNQSWRLRCVPVCRVRAPEPGRAGTVCPHVQAQGTGTSPGGTMCPRVQDQGAGTSPGGTGVSPCAGSGRRNQSWRHRCVPVSGSGCRNQAGVAQCVPVCRVRAREPGQAGTDCPRVQGQGAGTGSVHGCPLHGDEESRHRAGRRGWNAQGGRT